jgi:hypothetical protein
MRIQVTIPGEPNEETLGIALEAATRLAQHDLRSGEIPPLEDAIKGGIEWQEEPVQGHESFDKPSTVLARGWGDCDDLAPWLAAEMRETDFDPGATAFAVPSGHNTWHALVRGTEGDVYDPSVWAGMPHSIGGRGGRGSLGTCACCKPLNVGKPALCIGGRGVRVDVPGLRSTHGCVIGVSHQTDCENDDESRVFALVEAIEDAIVTAQLARTGDKRAIKQLAVIYRVLRGDDLTTACNGVGLRADQVGMNFDSSSVRNFIQKAREILASACDEAFAGDTWTASGGRIVKARKVALSGTSSWPSVRAHRMGFVPCLAPLAPLAAAATTAGTIAAVVGPLALALEKMVGEDTDFGRAMKSIMEVTDKVKIASAVGAGITGLIENGIPEAFEAGTQRWVELLQSPLSQLGQGANTQEVAKTLHWVEKNIASSLPPNLATNLSPQVLDLISQSQKVFPKQGAEFLKKAFELVEKDARKYLEQVKNDPNALPASIAKDSGKLDALARAQATHVFDAMVAAPPPPELVPIPEGAYTPYEGPGEAQNFPPAPGGLNVPSPAAVPPPIDFVAVTIPAEVQAAVELRDELHPLPPDVHVPQGWDDVFALGCLQQTDFCQ